jgi:hypothetical protein
VTRREEIEKAIEAVGLYQVTDRIRTVSDRSIFDSIVAEGIEEKKKEADKKLKELGIEF